MKVLKIKITKGSPRSMRTKRNKKNLSKNWEMNASGPRNLRTFYLQIRLFTITKSSQKISIRSPLLIDSLWMTCGTQLH
jgi:hypothetical protein